MSKRVEKVGGGGGGREMNLKPTSEVLWTVYAKISKKLKKVKPKYRMKQLKNDVLSNKNEIKTEDTWMSR